MGPLKRLIGSLFLLRYIYVYRGGREGARRRKALEAAQSFRKHPQCLPKASPKRSQSVAKASQSVPKASPDAPEASPKTPEASPKRSKASPKPPKASPKPPQTTPDYPRGSPDAFRAQKATNIKFFIIVDPDSGITHN